MVVCDLHLADGSPPGATITAVRDMGLRVLSVSGPALREEILEPTRIACQAAAEIASGGGWIGPKLAGHLIHDAEVRPLPDNDLTLTEKTVLRTLATGLSREETGRHLQIGQPELRTIHLRILDMERRRRRHLRLTGRQRDVLIKIGVEELPHRRAARELEISEATVAEHLGKIKDLYLRTHPDVPPDISPAAAARFLAREHGLR